ncbi:MAG: hypothetical protein N2234_02870 [Planctomycetota bacterium]|nr:hypothetical protein [Planctomycetota bacterium]
MEKRYPALRIVSLLYKILALLVFLLFIVGGVIGGGGGLIGGLILGTLTAVFIYAFGELFRLLIDVEENLRRIVNAVKKPEF